MVVRTPRLRQERESSEQRQPRNPRPSSPGALPEQAGKTDYPEEVYLVTYTADRRLQTHYYCTSREYTF